MKSFGAGFGGCLGVFVAGVLLVFFLFTACTAGIGGALNGSGTSHTTLQQSPPSQGNAIRPNPKP